MKNLLFIFLAITVIFAACEKEEELTTTTTPTTPTTTYDFSCKVGGDDFTDNSPIVSILNNQLIIDANDGSNRIYILIQGFSEIIVEEEINLVFPNTIWLTKDGVEYTNTQSGKLIFTKIGAELSGTFNFTSSSPSSGANKSVTEGAFVDLTY
tara:strand:- start:53 stop:511 length:459 start_codon:yes stop_codon:yes gene_type:complete